MNVSGQSMLPMAALLVIMLPTRIAVAIATVVALVFLALLAVRARSAVERRAVGAVTPAAVVRHTRYRGQRRAF